MPPEIETFPFAPFRRSLLAWYARAGRVLPWRDSRDPYRVWVSEIMLQQTTVVAVVPYFDRFMARFPTLAELAAADEQDVLRLWEGLGYYSRARNLHAAAREIVAAHGGRFPSDLAVLCSLRGIGRYTAGAIASFAFDRPAPILETNTLRANARLLGYSGDPRSTAGQRVLWEFAERVLPRKSAGQFNQALMDLGATVCRPDPDCDHCPVRRFCRAFACGKQHDIPPARPRPAVTQVLEAAVAIEREKAFLLRQRPVGERWAGLWDFVRFPAIEELPSSKWLAAQARKAIGSKIEIRERLPDIRHSVTRFRITLQCYRAVWRSGEPCGFIAWVPPERFGDFPLSQPARTLARIIDQPVP